ncbi:hypothetical protein EDB86DRAFT_3243856, partial [Lactarius hatsudake]
MSKDPKNEKTPNRRYRAGLRGARVVEYGARAARECSEVRNGNGIGKSGGKGAIDNRGKGDAKTRREEESRVREEPSIQRARESERVALRKRLGQKPWVLREFGAGKPFPKEAISVHFKTLGMIDFSLFLSAQKIHISILLLLQKVKSR